MPVNKKIVIPQPRNIGYLSDMRPCPCDNLRDAFVEYVSEVAVDTFGSHNAFARELFDYDDPQNAHMRWLRIRKRGQVTIDLACRIAQVIGLPLPSLMFEVCERAKKAAQQSTPSRKPDRIIKKTV